MADSEELDPVLPEAGDGDADEESSGRWRRGDGKRAWYWKVAWAVVRGFAAFLAFLVVARWMGSVWDNGWFQLVTALLLCVGIPVGFYVLIRKQAAKSGGKARFSWLTLMAMLSAPILLWVSIKHPTTFVDAARDEGLGAIKYLARAAGRTEPGTSGGDGAAEAAEGKGDTETAADGGGETEPATAAVVTTVEDGVPLETVEVAPEADDKPLLQGHPIPFESHGGHMIVEATVNGHEGVPFILDTGATHSTLSSAALAELGLAVGADAPRRTMQTAGGATEGPLLLVDSVKLGDHTREGVAFWVCEPCAIGDAVGLLGLNVWQGYLLTIDPVEQNIWLRPKESAASRTLDVEPFLVVTVESTRIEGDNLHVDLHLHNRSNRTIRQAVALVTVLDGEGGEIGAFSVDTSTIEAGQVKVTHTSMIQAGEAKQVQVELIDARW